MLIGTHVSIAGGIDQAPARAAAEGCTCFQIFTRSPQGGQPPLLTKQLIKKFRTACDSFGFSEWYVHTPYFINFASGTASRRAFTIKLVREELERASVLGAKYVMTHLGSAREVGQEQGLKYVATGLRQLLKDYHGTAQLLMEISAGAGATIGSRFEDLALLLEADERLGICFDTQHAFAAGYELRTPAGMTKTFGEFDSFIGLRYLKMSHVNDSKVALGAKVDRHEHIGQGEIGKRGFKLLLQKSPLKDLPLILETEPEGREKDVALLKSYQL